MNALPATNRAGAAAAATTPATVARPTPAAADAFLALFAAMSGGEVAVEASGDETRPERAADDDGTEESPAPFTGVLAQMLDFTTPPLAPPREGLVGVSDDGGEEFMQASGGIAAAGEGDGTVLLDAATGTAPLDAGDAMETAVGDALRPLQPVQLSVREAFAEPRIPAAEPVANTTSAANASPATPPQAGASSAIDQTLRTPVASPRWAEELGTRLVVMSSRGHHEGSLSLTPEHLGPLEVRITVQQNTANVWFGAQHADTRAALVEALPRLREMFAEAGLALGHTGVSHEAPRDQPAAASSRHASFDGVRDDTAAVDAVRTVHSITRLLDVYA